MSSLESYRAKRDFARTAEPRGRVTKKRAAGLGFVIQRHDATRLHYDLRLELDGVYKSWAVTKVPSLDPATKRLAVEVEDHPLEYGTFEGTIPDGQYGGGTVQLWDRGIWVPQGDDPQKDIADGHMKFSLEGERLKGGWALIRMKDDPKKPGRKTRHNWLLIKEKDDAAQPGDPDALLSEDTSISSGRTLAEIANEKRGKVWQSNRPPKEAAKTVAVKKNSPRLTAARPRKLLHKK